MAEIKKIVRSNPLSTFQSVAPSGGGAFELLAQAAETAYERLAPAAAQEQQELGAQLGRDIARSQIGDPQGSLTVSSMGRGVTSAPVGSDWVVNGLVQRGMPQHIAEAFAVNFQDESGLNPNINEIEPLVPGSRGGFGLAQWTGPRRVALEQFAAARGTAVGDADTQLDFLMTELQGPEAAAWSRISQAPDTATAAASIVNDFLRPAEVNRARREANYLGGNVSLSSSGGPASSPAVMLREADGKLTARLYSPLSGPILQAHNAAAGVAYLSEINVKATTDLLGMSEQFALNPEGFAEAARGYVDDLVSKAPDMFRGEVRAGLEEEVQRRVLGMVEERQRDTRQRAANSNQALIDKWTDELAAASVSGNLDAIAAAESKLSGALRARETLPGLSWTPEQSAETVRKAREEGARRVQVARQQQSDLYKSDFQTIIDAAQAGRTAAAEGVLDNPVAAQLHPELYREALAFTTLRDQLPSFNQMTPAKQRTALAEMRAQPVREPWEIDLYDAAEKAASANAKAWEEDPIKRAGEVLPPNQRPPALPQFDPNNPQGFIDGLAARAAYANGLVQKGFTERPVFLSKEDALAVGALFGKEVPPQLKAAGVAAIVNAMGKDAGKFLDQVSTADQGVKIAAGMMGSGVNPAVATEVITGQAMLDAKEVEAPRGEAVRGSYEGIRPAVEANPMMRGMAGPLRDAAIAIYAARVPVNADDATQKAVMEQAWQAALGQSAELGVIRGGVQEVAGNSAWLPPTMEGQRLDAALRKALGADATDRGWFNFGPIIGMAPAPQPELWSAAADGAVPWHGGQPLDPNLISEGKIMLTPVGGSRYVLSIKHDNGTIDDVGVQGMPDGVPFVFDAEKLIEAARSAP